MLVYYLYCCYILAVIRSRYVLRNDTTNRNSIPKRQSIWPVYKRILGGFGAVYIQYPLRLHICSTPRISFIDLGYS